MAGEDEASIRIILEGEGGESVSPGGAPQPKPQSSRGPQYDQQTQARVTQAKAEAEIVAAQAKASATLAKAQSAIATSQAKAAQAQAQAQAKIQASQSQAQSAQAKLQATQSQLAAKTQAAQVASQAAQIAALAKAAAGVAAAQAQQQISASKVQAAQAKAQAALAQAQAQTRAAQAKAVAQAQQAQANAAAAQARAAQAQAKAAHAPALAQAQLQQAQAKAQQAQLNAQAAQTRAQKSQSRGGGLFGTVMDTVDKFRGLLGGNFGAIVGGALDAASAVRGGMGPQATKQQIAAAMTPLSVGQQAPAPPPGMVWQQAPQAPVPAKPISYNQATGQWEPATPAKPFVPGKLAPQENWIVPPTAGTPAQPPIAGIPFQPASVPASGFGPVRPAQPAVPAQPGTAGVAPTPGVAEAGMSAGAMAGVAAAALAAMKAFKDGTNAAIEGVGRFTATMISASDRPEQFVGNLSSTVKSVGDQLFMLSPVASIFISNVGAMGQALSAVMGEIDALGQRYAAYSPDVAMAQAVSGLRQELGDFRRAQEAGPDLVNYIERSSQMQQKIEDTKIRILNRIMPLVEAGMDAVEKIMPIAESILSAVASVATALTGQQQRQRDDIQEIINILNRPEAAQLPTNLVRQGYPFTPPTMPEGAG